jgi:AcrR family transcriptional regulator
MTPQPSARDRLLDAAEDLAALQGLTATPVDVILARAGVSPATLYAHFGNKEGLMVQALERRLSRWDAIWQECVDDADTAEGRVLALFDALLRHRQALTPSRWCVFLGIAAETPERGGALEGVLEGDTRLLTDRLVQLTGPLVGAERARSVTDQLILIYTGVLGMILRGTDPVSAVHRGRELAALALRMAAAEAGSPSRANR